MATAQKFVGLVFQVGKSVRASVVTKSVATDDAGNDVIVAGHSNMEVSVKEGKTSHAALLESLSKIPAAKHLATGHSIAGSAEYDPNGTDGIVVLFGVLKTPAAAPATAGKSKG